MTKPSSITTDYLNVFKDAKNLLTSFDADWLVHLREEALHRFEKAGLPTRRDEDWRYDNLKSLTAVALKPNPQATPTFGATSGISGLNSLRILFSNGLCQTPAEQLPEGLSITALRNSSLSDAAAVRKLYESATGNTLGDLSAAMMQSGVLIRVEPNTEVRAPIQCIFHSTGTNPAQHMGVYIELGANSRLCLVDSHTGSGTYWTNTLQHIHLDAGARLCHFRMLDDSLDATHSAHRHVDLEGNATYNQHALYVGADTTRDCLHINIKGKGAHAQLQGALLGRGQQAIDALTRINHTVADATSNQTYKAVLKDSAKSAFQGRVTVKEGAIGTEAHQTNNNLLLDPTAEANAKPELMIFADDVKCSHGATVGALDKQAYFYLVSRGISPAEAYAMLVESFIGDVIDGIEILEIREAFMARATQWMDAVFRGNT